MENNKEKIISKIQKLLSLANSSNESEAKLAAEKAQELLLKYNLNIQSVESTQLDYEEKSFHEAKRLKREHILITQVIQHFYFVRAMTNSKTEEFGMYRAIKKTRVTFYGKKENVQIACYVFSFLCRAYDECWKKYREKTGASVRAKASYFEGLTEGLIYQLSLKQKKVLDETGLVLVADPIIEERMSKCEGTRCSGQVKEEDLHAMAAGIRDGSKLNIATAIENKSEEKGLLIEA